MPVAEIQEKGQRVYLMPDHASAIEYAKQHGGRVERRNLWAVVVKEGKHGDS